MAFKTGELGSPSAAPIIGANKVVITDAGGVLTGDPLVTPTELETLDGIDTSQTIQDQFDAITSDVGIIQGDITALQTGKQNVLPNFDSNELLIGDGDNVPSTLNNGANGQLLTIVAGVPAWQTSVNPTLPNFDNNEVLLGQGTQTPKTLDNGTNGQILTIVGGVPAWTAPTGGNSPPGWQDRLGILNNPNFTDSDISEWVVNSGSCTISRQSSDLTTPFNTQMLKLAFTSTGTVRVSKTLPASYVGTSMIVKGWFKGIDGTSNRISINGTDYVISSGSGWKFLSISLSPAGTSFTFDVETSLSSTDVYISNLYIGLRGEDQADILDLGAAPNIDFGFKTVRFSAAGGSWSPSFVNAKDGDIVSVIATSTSGTMTVNFPTMFKRGDFLNTVASGTSSVFTIIHRGGNYYGAVVPALS